MPPTPSPTDERLRDYIAKRMRMSHVYQPLMLMELLGRRSPAPAQDVARRILWEDVTQIDYYTERVKRMVGKVHLQRHHPLRPRRLRLGGRRGAERRRYLAEGQRGGATTRRAAATVPPAPRCLPNATRRGGGLFAHAEACGFGHRSRHRTLISGSMKVRMFTHAKGRCECCGAGCCLANPDPVTHGDPAAAGVRWIGVASAGVECGGGADRHADAHELCGQTVHRRRVQ